MPLKGLARARTKTGPQLEAARGRPTHPHYGARCPRTSPQRPQVEDPTSQYDVGARNAEPASLSLTFESDIYAGRRYERSGSEVGAMGSVPNHAPASVIELPRPPFAVRDARTGAAGGRSTCGPPWVEIAQQGHLGTVVNDLSVDVKYERRHRTIRERSLV